MGPVYTLLDYDFGEIVKHLQGLPPLDPSRRSESWRTADELLSEVSFQNAPSNEQELDEALCNRFRKDTVCPIRPAYYPGEDTCKRLWAHRQQVGRGPSRERLLAKLDAKPRPLEMDYLGAVAPIVFLSHALAHYHLAARVRLNLAIHGFRSWVAEGDLHKRSKNFELFESIHAALGRCEALITLVSSFSICSAWVYTETMSALKDGKKVIILIDASDEPICKLLSAWMSKGRKQNPPPNDWLTKEASEVFERYKRVTSRRRAQKFQMALDYALNSQMMYQYVAFYPAVPADLRSDTTLKGFEGALEQLGVQTY